MTKDEIKVEIRRARRLVRGYAQFSKSTKAIKVNEIYQRVRDIDNYDWLRLLWLIETRQVLNLKELCQ